eukprot:9470244-Pyramimonas_sp.AAC.1
MDTFIGFFVYSLVTMRRHLVGLIRKSRMCACGCKGWCSLCPIFMFLTWSFRAGMEAIRPTRRWDDQPFSVDDPHQEKPNALPCVIALAQIKGDWAEYCSSLGFPTWQSKHSPCIFCNCKKSQLFDFSSASLAGHDWGVSQYGYDAECRSCEVEVHAATPEDIALLLNYL